MNLNPVGIMQGRLLPPTRGRIQAFPVGRWREEFHSAAQIELDCIEWIYELDTEDSNPLGTDNGISEILNMVSDTGISVLSVCGDYYMFERLITLDGEVRPKVMDHLKSLIEKTSRIGARYLVLPFVDNSTLKSASETDGLVRVLTDILPAAERAEIGIHLETDLPATSLEHILKDSFSHPLLRLTCDIGNEASLGFEPREHWGTVGRWLGSVHVKDRSFGGGTVPLGKGSANFPVFFEIFAELGYEGTFILQVARSEDGTELEKAKTNSDFVKENWQFSATDHPGNIMIGQRD